MTYNIRLEVSRDGANHWPRRREQLAQQVAFLAPDVMGVQEGLPQQIEYLDNALSDYRYVGVGREDGGSQGEFSAIYYKHSDIELLNADTFWLSASPERPSIAWGATFKRICTYAHFRHRATGRSFWFFNTHLDHESKSARLNGAKTILRQIATLNPSNEPTVLVGDFNATPQSPPIQLISQSMRDARHASIGPVFGEEGTFNGFNPSQSPQERIDYIFVRGETVTVAAYGVLSELIDGRFLSDHFPVLVRCSFASEN